MIATVPGHCLSFNFCHLYDFRTKYDKSNEFVIFSLFVKELINIFFIFLLAYKNSELWTTLFSK